MNDQTTTINIAPGIKWGEQHVALSDLPESSVLALAQRGANHIYGNEMASYAVALKKKETHSDDEIQELVTARREEKLEAILSGQLGVRAVGAPRATAFESLLRSIATERLTAKLAKAKLKLPKGARKGKDGAADVPAGVIVLKTANGPKEFTRDDLISNELSKYSDEIKAEANRRLDEAKASAEGVDVEDII